MPTVRHRLAAAGLWNNVYVVGGWTGSVALNRNEEYNTIPTVISGNVKKTDGTNATNIPVAIAVLEANWYGAARTTTNESGNFTLNILVGLTPAAKILATAVPDTGAGGIRWVTAGG